MYMQRRPSKVLNYSPRVVHPSKQNHSAQKQPQFLYYGRSQSPPRVATSPKRVSSPVNIRSRAPSPSHSMVRVVSPPLQPQRAVRMGSPPRISRQSSQRILTPRMQMVPNQVPSSPPRVSVRPSNVYYQMSPQPIPQPIANPQNQFSALQRVPIKVPKSSPSQPIKRQQNPFVMIERCNTQKLISPRAPSQASSKPPSIKIIPPKPQLPIVANIASIKDLDEPEVSTSVNMSRIYNAGFAQSEIQDVMRNIQQRLNRIEGKASRSSQYFN